MKKKKKKKKAFFPHSPLVLVEAEWGACTSDYPWEHHVARPGAAPWLSEAKMVSAETGETCTPWHHPKLDFPHHQLESRKGWRDNGKEELDKHLYRQIPSNPHMKLIRINTEKSLRQTVSVEYCLSYRFASE